jgi:hypothetical protein
MWAQGFGVVAPLVWLISLLVTLWLGLLPFQDDNPEPPWKRRKNVSRRLVVGGTPAVFGVTVFIASIRLTYAV